MIDLHLHTSASDGRLSPRELVTRAHATGVRTLAITDHDTVEGLEEGRATAASLGLTFVDGIEITAVERERDVHVLGYFIDTASAGLLEFLRTQRADRVRRITTIAATLEGLGVPVDLGPLLLRAREHGRSVGRPHVADALIAAGHVATRDEAFDRFIGRGRAAFVPRQGAPAADVIALIHAAGGLSSLAHPGQTSIDGMIAALASSGLDALEARHADHDGATEARYRALAARHRLAVTGGSDFHSDDGSHHGTLGRVWLPEADYAAFVARRR